MFPALVHSAKSTSATRRGSTKTDSLGGRSPAAKGEPSRRSGSSSSCSRFSSFSLKPVPTRPT